MKIDRRRIARATVAWIATFAVAFLAWYVMNYTDYPEVALVIVLIGILPFGAYACWQTIPAKE